MKQITLRGIDDRLDDALKAEAERSGTSVNRFVLSLLRRALGLERPGRRPRGEHHDLDHLAGSWTPSRSREFERAVAEQRPIDEEIWK